MNALAKYDSAVEDFKNEEKILFNNGFLYGWLRFAQTLLSKRVGISFARCKIAANFLMGTESVDLAEHNIVFVDNDSVIIDGFLIEHLQLSLAGFYHHYFKVTAAV